MLQGLNQFVKQEQDQNFGFSDNISQQTQLQQQLLTFQQQQQQQQQHPIAKKVMKKISRKIYNTTKIKLRNFLTNISYN